MKLAPDHLPSVNLAFSFEHSLTVHGVVPGLIVARSRLNHVPTRLTFALIRLKFAVPPGASE